MGAGIGATQLFRRLRTHTLAQRDILKRACCSECWHWTKVRLRRDNVQEMNKKLCFSVQCTRIPVHWLVHFVMLEILVHFYYSSNVLKQTTFWCGRFQDSSCNSCNDIEGSVCEPPRDTMRVSRTVFLVARGYR